MGEGGGRDELDFRCASYLEVCGALEGRKGTGGGGAGFNSRSICTESFVVGRYDSLESKKLNQSSDYLS